MEGKLNSLVYLYLAEVDPKVRIVRRFQRLCTTIKTSNSLDLEERKLNSVES